MSRASLYGRSQILVGDRTSHDGVVLSGSPTNTWHDISIVRMNDRVWCPRCTPHLFEGVEGLENCTDAGIPMAIEGHRTSCGAVLIAESSPFGLERARALARSIATGSTYDEQVKLENDLVEGLPYFVQTPDGTVLSGRVEAGKLLPRIFTDNSEIYEVLWGDEALARIGSSK